jgi:hypothetical protein
MIRALLNTANTQQEKYTFVFTSKPGAGGSVAANTVASSTDLTILASSSSFYIRPLLYIASHDVEKFDMIASVCVGQPLAIFSKKLSSLSDISGNDITIGVIPGSITTLVARSLKIENPGLLLREIPYKGTPEATIDMLGGHIDSSVDFIGKNTRSKIGDNVNILGITGTRNFQNHATFSSMNIKGSAEIVNDYYFYVNSTVSEIVQLEINKILISASGEKVKELCEDEFGTVVKAPHTQLHKLNSSNKDKWKRIATGIIPQ